MTWPVRWDRCPVDGLRDMLRAYLERGELPPGGHPLLAILENDWRWAVMLSNDEMDRAMRPLAAWMHNELPPAAWGSCRAVQNWVAATKGHNR
jgi:hypothetical protein